MSDRPLEWTLPRLLPLDQAHGLGRSWDRCNVGEDASDCENGNMARDCSFGNLD